MIEYRDWRGLYKEGWQKRLSPESYSHPAKAAYGLAVRIAEYLLEQNYIHPGDLVLDPFGGIGGFALPLLERGINVVLVELEPRFNDMAQGCECTGISKADWVRFQGRYDKVRYLDGRHWCPRCVMQAQTIPPRKFNPFKFTSDEWVTWNNRGFHQPALFGSAGSATHERNSGRIPHTEPHHYVGNLEAWNEAGYDGRAVMIQGDSRHLCEVLGRAGFAGAVASPPYANSVTTGHDPEADIERALKSGYTLKSMGNPGGQLRYRFEYGTTPGQLASLPEGDAPLVPQAGAVVSSMPFGGADQHKGGQAESTFRHLDGRTASRKFSGLPMGDGYGNNPANLGNLPAGDLPAAVVSSMPFTNSLASDDPDRRGGLFRDPKRRGDRNMTGEYGVSDGQLGAMAEGQPVAPVTERPVAASVSSPPWYGTTPESGDPKYAYKFHGDQSEYGPSALALHNELTYMSPEWLERRKVEAQKQDISRLPIEAKDPEYPTFWAASAEIMRQVYQVLAPGGYTAWVCKRFVRDHEIVEFSQQWAALGETCGFETVEWIHAWLTEDRGSQWTLEGDLEHKEVRRMSFFRQLHVKKFPHLAIEWEDVVIQRKPPTT